MKFLKKAKWYHVGILTLVLACLLVPTAIALADTWGGTPVSSDQACDPYRSGVSIKAKCRCYGNGELQSIGITSYLLSQSGGVWASKSGSKMNTDYLYVEASRSGCPSGWWHTLGYWDVMGYGTPNYTDRLSTGSKWVT